MTISKQDTLKFGRKFKKQTREALKKNLKNYENLRYLLSSPAAEWR